VSTTNSCLPPNTEPLLPSQARTSSYHYLTSNVAELAGLSEEIVDELTVYANELEWDIRDAPSMHHLLVSDWLLFNLAKYVDDEAIKKAVQRGSSEIQRPDEPVGSDGLLQSWFGEPTEFRQPRIQQ